MTSVMRDGGATTEESQGSSSSAGRLREVVEVGGGSAGSAAAAAFAARLQSARVQNLFPPTLGPYHRSEASRTRPHPAH